MELFQTGQFAHAVRQRGEAVELQRQFLQAPAQHDIRPDCCEHVGAGTKLFEFAQARQAGKFRDLVAPQFQAFEVDQLRHPPLQRGQLIGGQR